MFWRLIVAGWALLAAASLSSASAQDQLIEIAETEVNLGRGIAEIDLSRVRGSFKEFRIKAVSGDIYLTNVQFRYSDGTYHNESRGINLTGDRTRPIDPGADKFVEGVTLCYRRTSGRLTVQVQGLQSRDGRRARRPQITRVMSWPSACPGAGRITLRPSTEVATRPTAPIPQTAPAGTAFPNSAVLFGTQNVGFVRDRDVIRVGAHLGQFDRIQLRVLNNEIRIRELDVVYADGDTQRLVIDADIPKDSRTRWLDIKGDKFISEIRMLYRSRPSLKGQARIEVYGQYARDWLGPNGRGRRFNEGWVLLGAQSASRFLRAEVDTISVGYNEGRFKRIRITVKDRALVFDTLRIVYGNGEEEVIPVKTTIAANATYGPVDLKGTNRIIKEVKARYRSAVIDAKAVGRGASVVEIWGQH